MTRTVGDVATLTYQLLVDDAPTDATVTVNVTAPDGTQRQPTVVHEATGSYSATVLADQAGTWTYLWVATGEAADVDTGRFLVTTLPPIPAEPCVPPQPWWPTAQQVRDVLITRLANMARGAGRPTQEQVEGVIGQAATELAPELVGAETMPPVSRDRVYNLASWAVTLNSASLIEANFFPEQQDGGQAERLYQRYLGALVPLRTALQGQSVPVAQFSGSVSLRPGMRW